VLHGNILVVGHDGCFEVRWTRGVDAAAVAAWAATAPGDAIARKCAVGNGQDAAVVDAPAIGSGAVLDGEIRDVDDDTAGDVKQLAFIHPAHGQSTRRTVDAEVFANYDCTVWVVNGRTSRRKGEVDGIEEGGVGHGLTQRACT